MEFDVRIITGPPADKLSKKQAHAALVRDPRFPKNASVELETVEGRWIAAIATPSTVKQAGPFDGPEGPPAGPPTDGPPAPESEGPPSDDGEKPKEDKGEEKGEKGLEAQIHHLTEMLSTIVDALGLGTPDGNPVPGEDAPHKIPGEEGPPTDDEGKTHTVHERSMKPGEAPPGSTPVGAPAFASVRDDHPWKDIIGVKKTFKLEEPIGDQKLADVRAEIAALAEGTGYKIAQLVESRQGNQRTAKVLMQAS